jgi:hypothetical protein
MAITTAIPGLWGFLVGIRNPGSNPAVEKMWQQVGEIYSAFIRRRYVKLSRGGGEWPDIKTQTLVGRQRSSVRRVKEMIEDGYLSGPAAEKALKRAQAKVHRLVAVLGGGDQVWARARAKGTKLEDARKKLKHAILIDTGTLLGTLTIGASGNISVRTPEGYRFGIGGAGDIGTIANAHNEGSKRLPKRTIIVKPDEPTMAQIKRVCTNAVKESIRNRHGK